MPKPQPKVLGQPPSIQVLARPVLVKKALGNTRKYDIFHPSAWGYCHRKIAYQYYQEKYRFLPQAEEDVDDRMMRLFDNGHGMHARWQRYLADANVLVGLWKCDRCGAIHGTESKLGVRNPLRTDANWNCQCGARELSYEELSVRSEPQYNFEGHVDAVVDLTGTEWEKMTSVHRFVVDFKTINKEQFLDLREAKYEHVVQVHIYMWLLGLAHAVVAYECKDNQMMREFCVPRDEKMINKIMEEARRLLMITRAGKVPPRPAGYSRSGFPCKWCEFAATCYE